ncbi:MAG: amino acid ABC transporter permease [Thermodesulfobacteriota bacterium]
MLRYWLEKSYIQYCVLFILSLLTFGYFYFYFDFGYDFDWSIIFTVNDTYGEHFGFSLLSGLQTTFKISLLSSGAALILGIIFGLGRLSSFKPLKWVSTVFVEFFRNTPLLVQLFFWYFAMPTALPESIKTFLFAGNFEFLIAAVGLSVYTGSFMAEIIRAGLQSIDKGLLEAAYSSGLSYFQVLRKIILPVAFRNIIPPMGSEFLNNMKNSSLAMVVGVAELTWQSQQVESLTFRGFEATTAATVLYLLLSLVISFVLNIINTRLKRHEVKKENLYYKISETVFNPLNKLIQFLKIPYNMFVYREKNIREHAIDSETKIFLKRSGSIIKKSLVLSLKGIFIFGFCVLIYEMLKGLAVFNFGVIRDNLLSLLIWRFPNGSENELFMGLGGLSFSVLMAFIAIFISFFVGIAVGVARTSENKIFRIPALVYIEFIRGNPLIIVIFWVYFFIPVVTDTFPDVFWSATIALTIFTCAYIAEIVRSGIENLPKGQFEAAYSTGLSYLQTMRLIILPQALKQMIPAIVGQFIAIFKDTSLAYVIGVLELTFVAQGLNNRLMVHPFEIYTTTAFLYFICCYLMSRYARKLERKLTPGGDSSLVM